MKLTALIMTLTALGAVLTCPFPAKAHRLNVFCWVNGGSATCECSFSTGRAVHNATMDVIAAQTGKILLTGRTDNTGTFTFSIPEAAREQAWDLKVLCTSTMGHASSWTIRAQEHAPDSASKGTAAQSPDEDPGATAGSAPEAVQISRLTRKELRDMIASAVSSQLEPVHRELSRLRTPRTNVQDILGGVGYIFGIMGVIMFFKSRGRARKDT